MLGLVVNSRTSKIRASKFLLARSRATVRLKMQSKAERPPASTPVPRAHRFDEPNKNEKYGRDPLGSVPGQADVPAAGGGEGGLEKGQKTMCTFTYRVNFPGTLLFVLLFNGYL